MEEERSKLGKSSWIMLGVAVLGLGIFIAVFMKLQAGHDGDVAGCVEKCKALPECRFEAGESGDPCTELCGIAPSKTITCIEKHPTCEGFSNCVVENP